MTSPRPPTLLDRMAARARLGELGTMQPGLVRLIQGWFGAWFRLLHRPHVEGLERLPEDGPFLIVSNHSGGGIHEAGVVLTAWVGATGGTRRMAAVAHPLAFHLPGPGRLLREVGAVPSTYGAILDALRAGVPIIIFPGGEYEAFRPFWQANRVDFNGRRGFLRIAREAGVPVVPLGIRGTHLAVPMLWRSRFLLPFGLVTPRLLGVKRFPLTLLGLLGAAGLVTAGALTSLGGWGYLLAWAWLASPLQFLVPVLPLSVRLRFGDPICAEELFGDGGDEALDAAYLRIVEAVRQQIVAD